MRKCQFCTMVREGDKWFHAYDCPILVEQRENLTALADRMQDERRADDLKTARKISADSRKRNIEYKKARPAVLEAVEAILEFLRGGRK